MSVSKNHTVNRNPSQKGRNSQRSVAVVTLLSFVLGQLAWAPSTWADNPISSNKDSKIIPSASPGVDPTAPDPALGPMQAKAQAMNSEGHQSVVVLKKDMTNVQGSIPVSASLPRLPLEYIDTTYKAPKDGTPVRVKQGDNLKVKWVRPAGRVIFQVSKGADLQRVLDNVRSGDIVEVAAGATFIGNFILRNHGGTEKVLIRSSRYAELPPVGTRIDPIAFGNLLPKFVNIVVNRPAIAWENGAGNYRLIGIEAYTTVDTGIVVGGNRIKQLSDLPHDITIDRSYIHGNPTKNVTVGFLADGKGMAVIDSYISDIHHRSKDSQAILVLTSPGPIKIVNNYLEAAGENVMLGGGDPKIPGMHPKDVEVQRNDFFKLLTWKIGDPSYAGIPWIVKNLFELKFGSRIFVNGNRFVGNWRQAQDGFAWVLKSANQNGTDYSAETSHVTFTSNFVGGTSGVSLKAMDGKNPRLPLNNILIKNNVFELEADGIGAQINGHPNNITIDHNTFIKGASLLSLDFGKYPNVKATSLTFTNNIGPSPGVVGSGKQQGTASLDAYVDGYKFSNNAFTGKPAKISASTYPRSTFFPKDVNAVGFTSYNNGVGGDYRLSASSPYLHSATDKTALGADINAPMKAAKLPVTPPSSPIFISKRGISNRAWEIEYSGSIARITFSIYRGDFGAGTAVAKYLFSRLRQRR